MPSRLVRLVRAGRIHWFPTTLVRSRCHGPSHANFPRADAVRRRSGLRLVRTLLRRSFVSPSITLTPFYPSQFRARSLSHSGLAFLLFLRANAANFPSRSFTTSELVRSFSISIVRPSFPSLAELPPLRTVPHPLPWLDTPPRLSPLDRYVVRSPAPTAKRPSERPPRA